MGRLFYVVMLVLIFFCIALVGLSDPVVPTTGQSGGIQMISLSVTVQWQGAKQFAGTFLLLQTDCNTPPKTLESATAPLVKGVANLAFGFSTAQPVICLTGYANDSSGINQLQESFSVPNPQPFLSSSAFVLTKVAAKIVILPGCTAPTCKVKTANTLASGSTFVPTFQWKP